MTRRLRTARGTQSLRLNRLPALRTLHSPANDYQSPRAIGSFSWGGAFNTTYGADPKERRIALIYTNTHRTPSAGQALGARFNVLTYAAMER